jgi:hypothetical protein
MLIPHERLLQQSVVSSTPSLQLRIGSVVFIPAGRRAFPSSARTSIDDERAVLVVQCGVSGARTSCAETAPSNRLRSVWSAEASQRPSESFCRVRAQASSHAERLKGGGWAHVAQAI